MTAHRSARSRHEADRRARRSGRRRPPTTGRAPGGAPRPPSRGRAGVGQHRTDRGGQRRRIALRHDDAGAAGEQLDGVRERGRHHRAAGGDGVDQHARRDLVVGVVRQHDQVGGTDQVGQRLEIAIRVVEAHARSPTPTPLGAVDEHLAVASPARSRTLGCVAPATMYVGRGSRSSSSAKASIAHSMPLPGPSRPQVSSRGR